MRCGPPSHRTSRAPTEAARSTRLARGDPSAGAGDLDPHSSAAGPAARGVRRRHRRRGEDHRDVGRRETGVRQVERTARGRDDGRRLRARRFPSGLATRRTAPADRGAPDGASTRASGAARTVPAPTRTTSAIARSRPMTNRSGSKNPLTSPPPELPSTSNATTPSRVDTKLAMTVGRSGRRATPSSPP